MELDDVEDFEALPGTASPAVHMLAGGMAGMLEHCAMYPFDVVKTRLQRLNPDPSAYYRGVAHCFRSMVAREGPGSLFRGMGVVMLGAGPGHALYFSAYERSKAVLGAGPYAPMATAGSAVCATFAHDSFMNPIEVIKQRMQMHGSPYTSMVQCIREVWRKEGLPAFYRSFTTSLLMNIPFHTTYLSIYELTRKWFHPDDGYYSLQTHLAAGGLAGACAAIVTTPLDVCKTLLNTNEQCAGAVAAGVPSLRGGRIFFAIGYAARTVYRQAGWRGFLKGWQARTLFTAPAGAISWSVYEAFKHFLSVTESSSTAVGVDSVLGTSFSRHEQDGSGAAAGTFEDDGEGGGGSSHPRSALPAAASRSR